MLTCFRELLSRLPCEGDAPHSDRSAAHLGSTWLIHAGPSCHLLQEAEQRRREQAAKSRQFTLGKIAYGKGLYPESRALLEQALNQEGPFSKLGGEIQLWLALAYQVGPMLQPAMLFELATLQAGRKAAIWPGQQKPASDPRRLHEAPCMSCPKSPGCCLVSQPADTATPLMAHAGLWARG